MTNTFPIIFTRFAAPIGRTAISAIFLMSGINKFFNYAATSGWMESMGTPGALLPLVIITEILGSIMVVLGWKTRWAAFALAGFSMLSAMIFHFDFSDVNQMNNFMKNFAIAGGFLMIVANGAGAYALDNRSAK